MTNVMLKQQTDKAFIKKACDRNAANVQAALITAASKMAIPSDIVSETDALDVLIDAYGLAEKPEVMDMLGMAPQFVKDAIGYSVDFNDASHAMVAYQADKSSYDAYYQQVAQLSQEKKAELDKMEKSM